VGEVLAALRALATEEGLVEHAPVDMESALLSLASPASARP
jgi:hypothetical protein